MGTCHPSLDKTKPVKSDEFIVRLHRQQLRSGIVNQLSSDLLVLDQRRLVFVSLIGLYQTWSLCPVSRLYSSIFVLPLKRKWIYDASEYEKEIKHKLFGDHKLTVFEDNHRLNQFLDLLRWKESQNLIFWMLDEHEQDENKRDKVQHSSLVAAFWIDFNKQLCDLYDPVTRKKYQPLKLKENFWRFSYKSSIESHFNIKAYKILSELYFVTKRFKAIQEIIYQSNPTLNPIVAYNPHKNHCIVAKSQCHKIGFVNLKNNEKCPDSGGFVSFSNGCCPDIDDDDCDDDDQGIWMISTEYNEYDLD